MSLALEFLTPQNPETSSAGIGTNWCFPTIARATRTTDVAVERLRGPKGTSRETTNPPVTQGNPPDSVARSPIATPTLQNCQ